jgi:hypothetical protein
MSRLNRHLSICPRLSPILPLVARVAIYLTNVLSRYCLLDLTLSLIVIPYSRHRMTSEQNVTEIEFCLEKTIRKGACETREGQFGQWSHGLRNFDEMVRLRRCHYSSLPSIYSLNFATLQIFLANVFEPNTSMISPLLHRPPRSKSELNDERDEHFQRVVASRDQRTDPPSTASSLVQYWL